MEDLKKMLGKKDKKEDPMKKEAKLSALTNLRSAMSDIMKDGLNGKMSKVTVAADDKEGLKEGLEKAKEMVEKSPAELEHEAMSSDEEESHEGESVEEAAMEEASEEEDMSEANIDEEIKKLIEKKKAFASKK